MVHLVIRPDRLEFAKVAPVVAVEVSCDLVHIHPAAAGFVDNLTNQQVATLDAMVLESTEEVSQIAPIRQHLLVCSNAQDEVVML